MHVLTTRIEALALVGDALHALVGGLPPEREKAPLALN
jgi:hypothetical protein